MVTGFKEWQYATPESQGVDSVGIYKVLKRFKEKEHYLHSFLLVRNGYLISENYIEPNNEETLEQLYSVSKSFTSAAVGIAVNKGLINIEASVLSYFPEILPENMNENKKNMKVKHLLTMSTGHEVDTTGKLQNSNYSWVKTFLDLPVEKDPGTWFEYNSGATYMLSAIIQKVTGIKLIDYIAENLFLPMGILNYAWDICPDGINVGGWGLHLCARDLAKFGLLYLNKGKWGSMQLVPEKWVEESSKAQVDCSRGKAGDWAYGYGYQFWRCSFNSYRADGAFGRYIIIMPEQNAVAVIVSSLSNMQDPLDFIHYDLLPYFINDKIDSSDLTNKHYTFEDNKYNLKNMAISFENNRYAFSLKYVEKEGRYIYQSIDNIQADGKWQLKNKQFVKMTTGIDRDAKDKQYVKMTSNIENDKIFYCLDIKVPGAPIIEKYKIFINENNTIKLNILKKNFGGCEEIILSGKAE